MSSSCVPGLRAALTAGAVLVVAAAAAPAAAQAASPLTPAASPRSDVAPRTQDTSVAVGDEPDGSAVSLDATVFVPGAPRPARGWPAVVLAHGYGGSKSDLAGQAGDLARRGYVVATYTARGFGASGGRIHLGSPEYEGRDVSAVIDVLAARDDVERDDGGRPSGGGDPVVGVAGASYGGAAALLAEGTDPRVDAVAAAITWNDLASSLTPQSVVPTGGTDREPGVLKSQWVGRLLGPSTPRGADGQVVELPAGSTSSRPGCGRLADDFCSAYLATVADGGVPTPGLTALLEASSPARVLDAARAPALLVQGEADTLFGLDASLANAAQLQAAGAPVTVAWSTGGHDAIGALATDFQVRAREFFGQHLVPTAQRSRAAASARGDGDPAFTYALPLPAVAALAGGGGGGGDQSDGDGDQGDGGSGARGGPVAPLRSQATVPAPQDRSAEEQAPQVQAPQHRPTATVALAGSDGAPSTQRVVFPAGGLPAAQTSIPGLGVLSSLPLPALAAGSVIPGQSAVFSSAPLERSLSLAGPASVDLTVAGSGASTVLFAGLYDVDADGAAVLPGGGVAALRVDTSEPASVRVALPALARVVPAGHRLRLVVASTDSGYAMPDQPSVADVGLTGERALTLTTAGPGNVAAPPLESATTVPTAQVVVAGVLAGLALVGALVLAARRRAGRRRAHAASPSPEGAVDTGADRGGDDDVVLSVDRLVLEYRGGVRAVDDASFAVRRGQVVGLLGPNGAGKTTTLRVVLGLIKPTAGSVTLLGTAITPGAPVLARVGALVEGTGFLPHLSGRENLELFWRATGRPPGDAHLDRALAVADLGDRVERRVGSYSQGMRMRLGIASALLGLPELLVLDEPTNGLDPPQITAMRQVLRDYAATGRTVIVSSHLLAEVEATCSHVVVMARGSVLAQGSVAELVGTASAVSVEVGPGEAARAVEVVSAMTGDDDDGHDHDRHDGDRDSDDGVRARVDHGSPGDRVLVTLAPGGGHGAPAVAADEVVSALVRAGVAVRAVVPQRHLEQVFLELVGEQ